MPRTPVPPGTLVEESYEDIIAAMNRRAAQSFAVDDLVRLADDVGTKRERTFIFRVVGLKPVRGQNRTDYIIQPVQGGPRTVAQNVHLDPASERDKAIAAATPVATFTPVVGNVVTVAPNVLRGANPLQKFVVLAVNRDATVKLALLGGDGGRYYPKAPIAALTLTEV